MERMMEVIKHFKIPFSVVINRYDMNEEKSKEIEALCEKENIRVLGKISFDEKVNAANSNEMPVVEVQDSRAAEAIQSIFKKLRNEITV
jgi:MinD superfamily P-loop ATPase